jgi:hypothetical protein
MAMSTEPQHEPSTSSSSNDLDGDERGEVRGQWSLTSQTIKSADGDAAHLSDGVIATGW